MALVASRYCGKEFICIGFVVALFDETVTVLFGLAAVRTDLAYWFRRFEVWVELARAICGKEHADAFR